MLECCKRYFKNPKSNVPWNNSRTATDHPFLKPSTWNEQDMPDSAGEVRTNSEVTFSSGRLHINVLVLADQENLPATVVYEHRI